MTEETARRALELAFRSPSPHLKIEFQGGEPLLNFPLVRWITAEANRMNKEHGKELAFVIATNLALLDEEILSFCAENQIHISTSLDGPQDLHNGNRRRPGRDSWQQAVAGIRRVQERLGAERVSALMTTTQASLDRAAEIIDTYAGLGLRGYSCVRSRPTGSRCDAAAARITTSAGGLSSTRPAWTGSSS
jgi:sulfatase maturation enzyme AslB (radical SAM superfamily)